MYYRLNRLWAKYNMILESIDTDKSVLIDDYLVHPRKNSILKVSLYYRYFFYEKI